MQELLVLAIVLAAALSAAWRLMGLASRLRLLDALSHSPLPVLAPWAAATARRLRESAAAGVCGSCAGGSAAGKRPAGR